VYCIFDKVSILYIEAMLHSINNYIGKQD